MIDERRETRNESVVQDLFRCGFIILFVFLFSACSDYKDMYQDAYASMWDDESVDVVSSSSISNSNKEPEDEESSSEKKSSSNSNKKNSSSSKAKSSSSSVVKSSSSVKNSSSSKKSSSSQKPNQYALSSSVYQTSSATPTLGSDFGTCAPARTPIAKGDTVSWVLKAKDPTLLMNASTSWTMAGGTPDKRSAKGMSGRSQQTKYTASGEYNASVQVSVGAANYNIKCDPLHVNGDPITGCKCSTAETSVDFTANPNVAWAVSGCKTGAGIVLAYEWDGLAGETTYTKMFDTAHPGYTPKLKVMSTDNSLIEVMCPTVKVTEGPEYIFEINDEIPLESQEIKNGGCISIVGRWNNSIYRPTISVYCSMKATTSPVSFEMTYGTKVYKEKSYSSWGFSLVGGEIDQLKDGEISIDNICVQFTGAETVECRLQ